MKTADRSIIYGTGKNETGVILVGGLWRLWEQEGFPLEMAKLYCDQKGWGPDWAEVMCDAATSNNLPALMSQLEAFLDSAVIIELKRKFCAMARDPYFMPREFVESKRANGFII